MKRYIYTIFLVIIGFTIHTTYAASDFKEKWSKANNHYQNEEYESAIILYEEILSGSEHSAEIYYNLGNAYFKINNLGKSILNYKRAELLDPNNEDIQHNLAITKARTIDKIEPVPQFFLVKWINSLANLLSSNGWAVFILVFLASALMGVVFWLISKTLTVRKVGFYTALLSVILMCFSAFYAQKNYTSQLHSTGAIVLNSAAPVKSAPGNSGKDLFLLHEGTYITVLDQVGEWSEIRIEDGNKGWILTSTFEKLLK